MHKSFVSLVLMSAAAVPAFATLGGSTDSVGIDQAKLKAKHAVVETRDYTVHEMTRDDGTLIREYATLAGKVFGVSWSGPAIPDLEQLLGSYNAEFQSTLRAKRGRRGAAVVRNSDLVVESGGRTRAFHGRAYLNSILPSGVTADVVK